MNQMNECIHNKYHLRSHISGFRENINGSDLFLVIFSPFKRLLEFWNLDVNNSSLIAFALKSVRQDYVSLSFAGKL